MSEFDKIYEVIKDNKVGFRQEININNDKYLVFIRPDVENGGTEVVFRKLLKE
jgi:hypothetical protein